ncbi:MAG: glutathione S-transferase family protein [Gammaproteobacteria bacterium]|nr:glutathione S-transferase family protein [Gammaproteobacteria bacterium]
MLKIHHLVLSRSDRIVWLAEELGVKYELVRHVRNPETFRSPDSLWKVAPMGKAPAIQDGDISLGESGAIIEYMLDTYGQGRLRPELGTPAYRAYQQWMHAAESTLMVPIILEVLCTLTQTDSPALKGFSDGEYQTVFKYLNETLEKSPYVAGSDFTGADIMVTYSLHLANGKAIPIMAGHPPLDKCPAIVSYLERIEARPAFKRAVELCK